MTRSKTTTLSSNLLGACADMSENNDVAGLMAELEKVPTDTAEAILNKLSMSDGKGGRIELDGNNVIPLPAEILKQAQEQLKRSSN